MIDPYLDRDGRPTANRGISFVDAEPLRDYVTRLDAAGLQVHFHAIGDRAVRDALDSVEAARRTNGPTDTRPHISHIQVIHPDDVPRFARVGAVANAQPLWACHETNMDSLTIPFLGEERASWQYPFGSLLRAGARLAMGSDWSVSTANPLEEMEVAMTRVYPTSRGTAKPFLPGRGADARGVDPGVHPRLGVREPPRRPRPARSRPASWPTSPSSIGTCSRRTPARSATPRSLPRSSAGRRSSRIRPSAEHARTRRRVRCSSNDVDELMSPDGGA